jgi:hypothetical protein
MTKVLKEYKSSTGGTVQVFAWGLRHTAGKLYSGAAATTEVPDDVADKPRKGPGRPRKS